jgi:hypothetical protein
MNFMIFLLRGVQGRNYWRCPDPRYWGGPQTPMLLLQSGVSICKRWYVAPPERG